MQVSINRKHRLDVTMYGVKGDGETDDTDAIQTLLDSNLSLYFPYGDYMVDVDGLTLDASTYDILGDGACIPSDTMSAGNQSGRYYKSTVFKTLTESEQTDKYLFNIGGDIYNQNLRINGVTLLGGGYVGGMDFKSTPPAVVYGANINNIGIKDVQTGINIEDSPTVLYRNTFNNILMKNIYDKGIYVGSGDIGQMSFSNIEMENFHDGALAIQCLGSNISFKDMGIEGIVDVEGGNVDIGNTILMEPDYTGVQSGYPGVINVGLSAESSINIHDSMIVSWPHSQNDYGVYIGDNADSAIVNNFIVYGDTDYFPRYAVAFESSTPTTVTVLENIFTTGYLAKNYLPTGYYIKAFGGNFLEGYDSRYFSYATNGAPSLAFLTAALGTPSYAKKGFYNFKDTGTGGKFYQIYCDGSTYWLFTGTKAV